MGDQERQERSTRSRPGRYRAPLARLVSGVDDFHVSNLLRFADASSDGGENKVPTCSLFFAFLMRRERSRDDCRWWLDHKRIGYERKNNFFRSGIECSWRKD